MSAVITGFLSRTRNYTRHVLGTNSWNWTINRPICLLSKGLQQQYCIPGGGYSYEYSINENSTTRKQHSVAILYSSHEGLVALTLAENIRNVLVSMPRRNGAYIPAQKKRYQPNSLVLTFTPQRFILIFSALLILRNLIVAW